MRGLIFLLLIFWPGIIWGQASAVSKNNKGNSAFKKGKYAEAEALYKAAELEAPEKKEIAYNLANTYYKQGDFESAERAYEKAKNIKDPKLRQKALFNLGNALYRAGSNPQDSAAQGKLEKAASVYKTILKNNPSDYASKFNLEKTLQKIEQMKQQQNQQNKDNKDQNKDNKDQNKDNKDQNKNDKQDKKDQQKQDKDSKQNQDKNKQDENKKDGDKKDQGENKDEQKPPEDQNKPQGKKPGEMSEEEAKRLLDALKQDESDMQKRLMLMRVPSKKLEKDW